MNEGAIEISTDKQRLDVAFIHGFISNSYWAKNRTLQQVQTCIAHSLNFGVYHGGHQIGYARVLSDRVAFAYLLDVFIDEAHRGNGYSKQLMAYILSCDELKQVKAWKLATTDAHALYERFGFTALANPHKMMEKIIE